MRRSQFIFRAAMMLLTAALAGCGGQATTGEEAPSAYSDAMIREGQGLYQQTCFACHGADGTGVSGLGKDLTVNEFVSASSDEELLDYVKVGRAADDPANTTGVSMPPKGGFDFLTDDDILKIIAYIRSIQG